MPIVLENDAKCFSSITEMQAKRQGGKTAYIWLNGDGEEISSHTYADVFQDVEGLAFELQHLNGKAVLMLYESGMPFVTAFLSCLRTGVIGVPSPLTRPGRPNWNRLVTIAAQANVAAILTERAALKRLLSWLPASEALSTLPIIVTDNLESGGAAAPFHPHPDDVAFLQYTSGSTDDPKGAKITFTNLNENAKLNRFALGTSEHSRIVCWLPAYHDLGLIGNILNTIYSGATCVLLPPATIVQNPSIWLKAIHRYRADLSVAPNFAYGLAARRIGPEQKRDLDLSSWKLAGNTSEPIFAETIRRFSESFEDCGFSPSAFRCGYGLAEATLIVAAAEPNKRPNIVTVDPVKLEAGRLEPLPTGRELVSSGAACAPQSIVIVDPERCSALEEGEVGEIWVSGPCVAAGYLERSDLNKFTFEAMMEDGRGPYLRTGDLGVLYGGEIFVVGRLKEVIIIRGRKLFPQDIENVGNNAHQAFNPLGCAAFGLNTDAGEQIVIFQEISRSHLSSFDPAEAVSTLREAVFDAFDVGVKDVVFIKPNSVPRTSSGKIRRLHCRNLYLAGEVVRVGQ